ncbi:MAG: hypothetical protein ACK559_31710, partial [bacterium]
RAGAPDDHGDTDNVIPSQRLIVACAVAREVPLAPHLVPAAGNASRAVAHADGLRVALALGLLSEEAARRKPLAGRMLPVAALLRHCAVVAHQTHAALPLDQR